MLGIFLVLLEIIKLILLFHTILRKFFTVGPLGNDIFLKILRSFLNDSGIKSSLPLGIPRYFMKFK